MKRGGVVYYIAGDHLGTTSVVLKVENNQVTDVSESRYYPYGGVRWQNGTLQTDYRFTGQRLSAELGLYHMGVRWYDSHINRFLSPDSIIPDPANPQSLNRFSYALGNPLKYRDPSGHCPQCAVAVASAPFGPPGWVVGGILIAALTVTGILVADAAIDAADTSSQPALQASGGVAYPAPPPPDDPFRDLSDSALRRIRSHQARIAGGRGPARFRVGINAQLSRAEYYARQGLLEDYELRGNVGRYDLTLRGGDRIIEVKYWTADYARGHFEALANQLLKYQASGKQVILEMFRTKTNWITDELWKELLTYLKGQGVELSGWELLPPP